MTATDTKATSGLVEFMRSAGPASLASAAFSAGIVWAGLNAKIENQQQTISKLQEGMSKVAMAERLTALEQKHDEYFKVAEQRNRDRIVELTQLSERLAALADSVQHARGAASGAAHDSRVHVSAYPAPSSSRVHVGTTLVAPDHPQASGLTSQ